MKTLAILASCLILFQASASPGRPTCANRVGAAPEREPAASDVLTLTWVSDVVARGRIEHMRRLDRDTSIVDFRVHEYLKGASSSSLLEVTLGNGHEAGDELVLFLGTAGGATQSEVLRGLARPEYVPALAGSTIRIDRATRPLVLDRLRRNVGHVARAQRADCAPEVMASLRAVAGPDRDAPVRPVSAPPVSRMESSGVDSILETLMAHVDELTGILERQPGFADRMRSTLIDIACGGRSLLACNPATQTLDAGEIERLRALMLELRTWASPALQADLDVTLSRLDELEGTGLGDVYRRHAPRSPTETDKPRTRGLDRGPRPRRR